MAGNRDVDDDRWTPLQMEPIQKKDEQKNSTEITSTTAIKTQNPFSISLKAKNNQKNYSFQKEPARRTRSAPHRKVPARG